MGRRQEINTSQLLASWDISTVGPSSLGGWGWCWRPRNSKVSSMVMRCENCRRILMQLKRKCVKPVLWHSSCSMEAHYLVILLPVKQRDCVAPLLLVSSWHLQDQLFWFHFTVTGPEHVASLKAEYTRSNFNHAVLTWSFTPITVDNCTVIKLSSPAQRVWLCAEVVKNILEDIAQAWGL